MDEQAASTRVLGSAIVEWLTDEVLQDSEPAILYRELCQRLRGGGMRSCAVRWRSGCSRFIMQAR